MKKQYRNLNIRANDLFFKQLDYLRVRKFPYSKDFPFKCVMSRSEYIRQLIESEYEWAYNLDSRQE